MARVRVKARVRVRAARGMGGWHGTGKRQVWDIDASDWWAVKGSARGDGRTTQEHGTCSTVNINFSQGRRETDLILF